MWREEILNDDVLTEATKKAIIEYCDDPTVHSTVFITFEELFIKVWNRIKRHKESNEIKKVLNTEMNEAICKCFTGRIGRLVSTLVGFYDDINVTIGENEQISNIIIITKNKLEAAGTYTIEEHRALAIKELEERGYEKATIDEWIEYIQ